MPYIKIPKKISIDEYIQKRFKFLRLLSPKTIFRSGYADEFYPFPIIHTAKEVNILVDIQVVLHKALTEIVKHYFIDKDIQARVPLEKKVKDQLQRLIAIPYHLGAIRPDYIYSTHGLPMICEINARFIFNGFFMSVYMNDAFKDLFPIYQRLQGVEDLKMYIHKRFDNKDVAVVKEREDGYDIHSFLLEYPRAKLFQLKDLKKVLKNYATVVLELHQDEVAKNITTICDALLAGKTILNDPRTVFIVHDKRLLSVLSDYTIMKKYITAPEAALLRKHVIATYTAQTHKKVFQKALKNKAGWIGKKAISGKSDGLYIGKEKDLSDWKAILRRPDTLLQPNIQQKKFKLWDPYRRITNTWYVAGVLPMWDSDVFGMGLYRMYTTQKHKYIRFIQPMVEKQNEK